MINLSLGRDHAARKALPIMRVLGYFTAALAGLTRHAVRGNKQHNGDAPLHWARGKSADHAECVGRHSFDMMDMHAWLERNPEHPDREAVITELEHEYDARLWRAAADSQEFYEKFRGAPISPSSKLPEPPVVLTPDDDAGKIDLDALCPGMSPSLRRGFVPKGTVDEPVAQTPDEGAPRCGYMSRTKRVCTRPEGHEGAHFAEGMGWFGEGHPE
jgi:hypothetical protein